ncbi:hypothetical protein OYC64_019640 [Pagothenia borchgrevinki]|uniref:Uncharacterized protein n=1 Tax=Pagothenia borchgrevinki TaxID=8213 RepID=A0ABD2FIW1_PAGBO
MLLHMGTWISPPC